MTAIPCDRMPPPILAAYVDLNLKILINSGVITASGHGIFDKPFDDSPGRASSRAFSQVPPSLVKPCLHSWMNPGLSQVLQSCCQFQWKHVSHEACICPIASVEHPSRLSLSPSLASATPAPDVCALPGS